MPSRSFLLATAVLALAPSVAHAQPPAETGIARDARLGSPLPCLHVALLDGEERDVAHTVTDSAGTFVLVAPAAGTYRVAFEIFGWERLAGPVDTLRDGEMRERAYPLAFGDEPDRGLPGTAELRRRERDGWHSATAATPDAEFRLPVAKRRPGTPETVAAQYVVDTRGRVREDTWRAVAATSPEYLEALRAHAPAMRYEPARLDGQPVCQLVRNQARFEWSGPIPMVTLLN